MPRRPLVNLVACTEMRSAILAAAIAVAAALAPALKALPPVNSFVSFEPVTSPGTTLRHCNYVTSTCPPEVGNDDYIFK